MKDGEELENNLPVKPLVRTDIKRYYLGGNKKTFEKFEFKINKEEI